MNVPLLDLKAQYAAIRDDLLAAVTRVCDSQRFILGPEVELAEQELAARLGVKHAVGTSSGTDALLATLMALGIGAGDEVVTSTYSFFASAGSISRLGARPVFVDIDPTTYNMDPAAVVNAVTPRTKAIMPVHLFGLSADLDPVLEAARAADVPVIEDACQAIDARYHERLAGTCGTAGCISFFPSKGLGGFGDGGLVVTNDDDLAQRVRLLRGHGAEPKYVHEIVGGNFRLDALQAAVLRAKLPHLTRWIEAARRNADRYRELLDATGLEAFGVVAPVEPEGYFHTYHQFVVRVPRRDALRAHLEADGIGTAVYYPVPLHLQRCFRDLGYPVGACPHAERAASDTLALPMYGELTEEQQQYVVASIATYLRMS